MFSSPHSHMLQTLPLRAAPCTPAPRLLSYFGHYHLSPTLFLQCSTWSLASQDALWVIVSTIAEGIIPECKSDYVMSFPKIFSVATHCWVQAPLFSTLKLGNLAFAPYPDLTSWCLPQVLMFQPFWTIWADSRISHFSPCLCTLSSAWNAFLPYLP